jgi:hypothetical protein
MSAATKGKAKRSTTKKKAPATRPTAEGERALLKRYKAGESPAAMAAEQSWAKVHANPTNAVRRALVRAAGGLAEFKKIMTARRKKQQ